jgi:cytochrome bd-type quinol oxidase subunit 2
LLLSGRSFLAPESSNVPNLISSSLDATDSMTIYNSFSGHTTLAIMTIAALLFTPHDGSEQTSI